ncbi:MAG: hypothetical protein ACXU8U_13290, partial [Asticcacaulis sp.]
MTKRFLPALMAFSALSMAGLGGCHGSRTQTASTTVSQASASAPEQTAPTKTSTAASGPLACADEIGPAAAQRLVKMCLNMSGATHPPCNAENTCAMMQDEIARNCAMSDDGGHPAPECTPAPKSSEAAAAVVQLYYSALNARDYDTAWRQWGDNGPPNQTLAKFASGFAHTRSTHVTIGRLDPDEG